jgi:hypothetical protein
MSAVIRSTGRGSCPTLTIFIGTVLDNAIYVIDSRRSPQDAVSFPEGRALLGRPSESVARRFPEVPPLHPPALAVFFSLAVTTKRQSQQRQTEAVPPRFAHSVEVSEAFTGSSGRSERKKPFALKNGRFSVGILYAAEGPPGL